MSFASIGFLFYFLPAALLLYFLCSFSRVTQNLCLLVLSLLFYSFGEPIYMPFLLASILINYLFGLLLVRPRSVRYRTKLVYVVAAVNIALMLLGKYLGKVLLFLAAHTGWEIEVEVSTSVLGIAFFSLQAMSYIFDVSRGKAAAEKNLLRLALYISFFPTVLAGPIVRYIDIWRQIAHRKITMDGFGKGCARFVIGMSKQVLIAASLGMVADDIFLISSGGGWLPNAPVLMAWLGLIAYGLYLYFFFSGFSDMALGLAAMFGFSFNENFNYPLAAKSVTQFANRWNISLFRWVHVYVYIPLGGPRPKLVRKRNVIKPHSFLLRNLLAVWMFIGLWYGIGGTFVAWGILFFVVYLFEWIVNISTRELKSPLWHLYMFFFLCLCFLFLRSETFGDSMTYARNLLGLNQNGFYNSFTLTLLRENWLPFALGLIFSTPIGRVLERVIFNEKFFIARTPMLLTYYAVIIALLCISVVYISRLGAMPPTIF